MPSLRNSGKTDQQSTAKTTTSSTKAAAVKKGIVPPAKPHHHGPSDSLISFESWDYSAAADTACTTIETIVAGASSSIASQSSVDVFDDEENDFTLTTTTTTMPSTIVHIMDETTTTNTAAAADDVPKPDEPTIQVSVSGVIFSLKTSTFEKLHGLPWTWRQEAPSSHSQGDSFVGYSLGTSPLLFDHLLNHVLFGSLPVLQDLSMVDAEELEPLALLLRLENLQRHLDRKLRPHQNFAFLRRSSSCGSRILSGDNNPSSSSAGAQQPLAACHLKQQNQGSFAFLKRSMPPPPPSTISRSTTSSTTGRGRCLIDASPGASPVALIRKRLVDKSRAMLLRPPSSAAATAAPRHHLQNRRRHHHRQLSMEQLCAISDQLQ
jgi:hypothetical protein